MIDEMQAFVKKIQADPHPANFAVFGDWLEEQGIDRSEAMRGCPLKPFDIYSFGFLNDGIGIGSGIGSGSGRGSGIGSGIGSGSGSGSGIGSGIGIGSGRGSGIGSGRGSGIGSGIGSGRGSGIGSGSGRGSGRIQGEFTMEVGKAYLVHCGDWHTFIGRCVGQISAYVYLFDQVSKITETNGGDCWEKLCAGDKKARDKASYVHYKTQATIPLTVCAFEWEGKLPQEQ